MSKKNYSFFSTDNYVAQDICKEIQFFFSKYMFGLT